MKRKVNESSYKRKSFRFSIRLLRREKNDQEGMKIGDKKEEESVGALFLPLLAIRVPKCFAPPSIGLYKSWWLSWDRLGSSSSSISSLVSFLFAFALQRFICRISSWKTSHDGKWLAADPCKKQQKHCKDGTWFSAVQFRSHTASVFCH
jgi:hypothetical protein